MKFCCERFKSRHESPREMGLNIRVLKFSKEELIDEKKPYRFFVSTAYALKDKGIATLNIAYCPFCGTSLFDFYKGDEYINEIDSSFLYP